jgi:acetyl-CoA synthetase
MKNHIDPKHATINSMEEYEKLCAQAQTNPDGFWSEQAQKLIWDQKFNKVCEWNPPFAKWFLNGKLNASVQCLDKNVALHPDKTALIWEGEPMNSSTASEIRKFTYQELLALTCQASHALSKLGVRPGHRVAIYLPMIPEAIVAMLACARIGAAHSVIFGGFSSEALKDRLNDMKCEVVITSDGGYRRGKSIPLKENVDLALKKSPSVKKVLVVQRTSEKVLMESDRDFWWHDLVPKEETKFAPVSVESENPLFILYTSGTTGKPKGIVHSTAGYMLMSQLTAAWVFDLNDKDIYWCTADIGWITGHSYVVYGPLQNGTTVFMYEGAPNYPDWGRFWQMIDRHKISILYTAPTAIRSFMRAGDSFLNQSNLNSLRLLGSVGEPINPEAWLWYHKTVGKERCPIVDTWWQTETGSIMMSPLPRATPTKPGSCAFPLPGISAKIVNKEGLEVQRGEGGFLIIDQPWPSMLRGIYSDDERFKKTYFSDFKNKYFTGDGARQDQDGYFWVTGRVDDVLNVAGHRLGTAEIEGALASHNKVAEAAVVGKPDPLKGQAVVAFVTLKDSFKGENISDELKVHVTTEIGSIAKPDDIRFVDALPKTRSGKIMRRLLRELASGAGILGDTTTLEDAAMMKDLAEKYSSDET